MHRQESWYFSFGYGRYLILENATTYLRSAFVSLHHDWPAICETRVSVRSHTISQASKSQTHLQESRPCDDSSIGNSSVTIIKQQVRLAIDSTRHRDLEIHPVTLLRENRPLRSCSRDECGVKVRIRVCRLEHSVRGAEADKLTSGDRPSGVDLQTRESLDVESRVAGRAGSDERVGHGVDLIRREWVVLGLRVRRQRERRAKVRSVASLDGQDTAGGCEVVFVGNLPRGTQVGRSTNAFEDLGCGYEGGDAGDAEGVGAFLHRCGADGLQRGGEEFDVVGLLGCDDFDVVVEGGVEACRCEGGLGEVGQALAVEGVLEVLEGKGVVENVDCA